MSTIYLDPTTWDVTFPAGLLRMTQDPVEAAVQGARIKLQFWRGEWFLDTTQGVPYVQDVFVKPANFAQLEALFRRILTSVPEIDAVPVLSLMLDRETRALRVDWEIRVGARVVTSADYGPFVLGLING
jgi:hypothetical protein